MLYRDTIFDLVELERERQVELYGKLPKDLGFYIHVLEIELAELKLGYAKGKKGKDHPLYELLQVVAVGVAALEDNGETWLETYFTGKQC